MNGLRELWIDNIKNMSILYNTFGSVLFLQRFVKHIEIKTVNMYPNIYFVFFPLHLFFFLEQKVKRFYIHFCTTKGLLSSLFANAFPGVLHTLFFFYKRLCIFSTVFYSLWDYLKVTWAVKEIASFDASSHVLEVFTKSLLKKYISCLIIKEHILEYTIKDIWTLSKLFSFFKKSSLSRLNSLIDVFGRETFHKGKKIILVYNFISDISNTRVLFRLVLKDSYVALTCSDLFVSAAWVERECWDMLGVVFLGNLDLRRILTDYGFLGHPLRKEFPLTGFVEVRYNDNLKRIIFEPVEFAQELRFFDFSNPWNQGLNINIAASIMNFKQRGGGNFDFLGGLSNMPIKSEFKKDLYTNYTTSIVFARSGNIREYLRNHNFIYSDLYSEAILGKYFDLENPQAFGHLYEDVFVNFFLKFVYFMTRYYFFSRYVNKKYLISSEEQVLSRFAKLFNNSITFNLLLKKSLSGLSVLFLNVNNIWFYIQRLSCLYGSSLLLSKKKKNIMNNITDWKYEFNNKLLFN